MDLKEFQIRTLDKFERWHAVLEKERQFSEDDIKRYEEQGRDTTEVSNFPKKAWEAMGKSSELPNDHRYVERKDGLRRHIPHVCFKIPTGGGKTWLAAAALERLRYGRGLVLWVVPSKAIYRQTLKILRDQDHPVRVMLNRAAAGGGVRILEKSTKFDTTDIQEHLCVMLLTYQSFNRQSESRESLKMTQNAARYMSFFPFSDDEKSHDELIETHPDLEKEEGQVKRNLINVIKLCRPVVVIDEAHKTRGGKQEDEYSKVVSMLNPKMIVELSATPYPEVSNILVDVSGVEMDAEDMIKLPIKLHNSDIDDWKRVLLEGHEKLKELDVESDDLWDLEERYIRPIAVVRVERTGRDQHDENLIHVDDVKDYLLRLGVLPEQIAIKTSTTDELSDVDLLSKGTPIKWIITKAALMEGWDCPFAYVLIILDRLKRQLSLTQLLGRVLRQPNVKKTQNVALDRCYVFCYHKDTDAMLEHIRNGLEGMGMGDLSTSVSVKVEKIESAHARRRKEFKHDIFMPKVLHFENGVWSELDYDRHILSNIKWESIKAPALSDHFERATGWHETAIGVKGDVLGNIETKTAVYDAVRISDFVMPLYGVVPNAWHASRIVKQWLNKLRASGKTDQDIMSMRTAIISHMQEYIESKVTKQAEDIFSKKVGRREIRFDLEVAERNFKLAETYVVSEDGKPLMRKARPVQHTLFEPVYETDFDTDLERCFAKYLDESDAIRWWHRVAARRPHEYYVRGWKPDRIWPDFIAMAGKKDDKECVLIYETKGGHLDNQDTEYKRKVFEKLENAFNCGMVTVNGNRLQGKFQIVFEDKYPLICHEGKNISLGSA